MRQKVSAGFAYFAATMLAMGCASAGPSHDPQLDAATLEVIRALRSEQVCSLPVLILDGSSRLDVRGIARLLDRDDCRVLEYSSKAEKRYPSHVNLVVEVDSFRADSATIGVGIHNRQTYSYGLEFLLVRRDGQWKIISRKNTFVS